MIVGNLHARAQPLNTPCGDLLMAFVTAHLGSGDSSIGLYDRCLRRLTHFSHGQDGRVHDLLLVHDERNRPVTSDANNVVTTDGFVSLPGFGQADADEVGVLFQPNQQNKAQIEALRQEVKSLSETVRELAYEVRRIRENEAHEREKMALRLLGAWPRRGRSV